jgi:integrase
MASVRFYLDHPYQPGGKKLKKTPVAIWVCVTFSKRDRVWWRTEYKILPGMWDFKDGRVKAGTSFGTDLNLLLDKLNVDIQGKIIDSRTKGSLISAIIKKEYNDENQGPERLQEAREAFLAYQKLNSDFRTWQKFQTLFKRLKEFEDRNFLRLSFDSFDLNFYDNYRAYLINNVKGKVRKNEKPGRILDDTLSKYIADLKVFLAWSSDRGFNKSQEFRKWKAPRKKRHDNPVLSYEELMAFHRHRFKDPELAMVRDVFCFGAFTGQRIGDIMGFDKADIKGDTWTLIQGKNRMKAPVTVKIPLRGFSEPALRILEKYRYRLPKFTEQRFNILIKDAGNEAGINKPVKIERTSVNSRVIRAGEKWRFMSSHMMRRTFITMLLERGVPPTTIMKLSGHKKLETLLAYENTSDEAVIKELDRVGRLTLMKVSKR